MAVRHFLKMLAITTSLITVTSLQSASLSFAQEPETSHFTDINSAIHTLDTHATLRDDALVSFSNGNQYVLVNPISPKTVPSIQVVQRLPLNQSVPDIILFNDGHFLLRMVSLPGGRKTFPIIDNLPPALKEGLIPQQFSFPDDFLIPTQWKALTGDILTTPPPEETAKPVAHYPLLIPSPENKTLYVWDTAKNQVLSQYPLSDDVSAMAISDDAKQIFLASQENPVLKIISTDNLNAPIQEVKLPKPASDLKYNDETHLLYIAYGTLPKLSVFNPTSGKISGTIVLQCPVSHLILSHFRKQLFAVSIVPPKPKVKTLSKPVKQHFVIIAGFQKTPKQDTTIYQPNIQLINLTTGLLEKSIPTRESVVPLAIQDEKILWMSMPQGKKLLAYDLRWQELSPPIPVPEVPKALAYDRQWLYLLMPESNELGRMNINTLAWGSPIPLASHSTAEAMMMDPFSPQVYVLSDKGLEVINITRGEWIGTEAMAFGQAHQMAMLMPASARPDPWVRIKFQDGRLMLQNAQGLQWETLPSLPRVLQKNPGLWARLKKHPTAEKSP